MPLGENSSRNQARHLVKLSQSSFSLYSCRNGNLVDIQTRITPDLSGDKIYEWPKKNCRSPIVKNISFILFLNHVPFWWEQNFF